MSNELTKHEPSDVATIERTHGGRTYSPRVDIWETDEELVLKADLPGVSAENLDIQFENRELRIHGKVSPRHEGFQFLHGEYEVGDFYRTFAVGEAIDVEKVSAELKDGVLSLHLPKSDSLKPRKIEVKSN